MGAEGLAGLAALGFAASLVTARQGLRGTGVLAGALLTSLAAWLVLVALVSVDPPSSVPVRPALLVALSGLVSGPGVAGAAVLLGLDRLGPSVHGPLQGGTYGVAILVGATVLLGEAVGPLRGVGVVAIVAGGARLARREGAVGASAGDRPTDGDLGGRSRPRRWVRGLKRAARPGAAFPILAGAGFAAGDVVSKSQLDALGHAGFASMVAMGAGLVFWAVVALGARLAGLPLVLGRGVRWFLLSGALLGLALMSLMHALVGGDVSTVGPIVAAEPLAVLVLSAVFLRGVDRITGPTVASALLVVAGSVLVSL